MEYIMCVIISMWIPGILSIKSGLRSRIIKIIESMSLTYIIQLLTVFEEPRFIQIHQSNTLHFRAWPNNQITKNEAVRAWDSMVNTTTQRILVDQTLLSTDYLQNKGINRWDFRDVFFRLCRYHPRLSHKDQTQQSIRKENKPLQVRLHLFNLPLSYSVWTVADYWSLCFPSHKLVSPYQ